ncbi:RimJ/RimL family protein N-acetyltransferase [Bacillus oleivorans]|uniref:RimJ/RimL family protein N-acetyltransferase n=1 Tax=Bacillus oleivorans TaxID=1448271 RepID=A0A285CLE1_9BACI|nr:GNAT family N-acetyltransferase [Bacillus oleivorans]SNX68369.1 RimJ/RimL family protein N-acetyltransferase [Bacillus oleivorans]
MLKKRNIHDSHTLFELMIHPEVFPFVRQKASSYEEYVFITKQTIEAEEQGKLISRTITDEWGSPIGTINLFDIEDNSGFLGTWIGKPYHGKGYNKLAKDAFFNELFLDLGIETVWMRIRKENVRSKKAAEKLPYCLKVNNLRPAIYRKLNPSPQEEIFDLYEIPKDLFLLHLKRMDHNEDFPALEA